MFFAFGPLRMAPVRLGRLGKSAVPTTLTDTILIRVVKGKIIITAFWVGGGWVDKDVGFRTPEKLA